MVTLGLGGIMIATFQNSMADLRSDLRSVQSDVRAAAITSSQVIMLREKQMELDTRIRELELGIRPVRVRPGQ